MHTLRSAATLLAAADSLDGLTPIAAALGFGAPAPLDVPTRSSLGIPPAFVDARCAPGRGALRALLLVHDGPVPLRESVQRLASRLAGRGPHAIWLALIAEQRGTRIALATWSAARRPPRVAALLADRAQLVDSDAETCCAMAALADGPDALVHARWLDVLGRDALTRRFYRLLEAIVLDLAGSVAPAIPESDARELALLLVSRLLFLAFVETKGWLDGDRAWLQHAFDRVAADGGDIHRRLLQPLFFGTLNTPRPRRAAAARVFGRIPFLNGGLFAPAPVERRWRQSRFRDEHLGRVFGELLARHRFTALEHTATWSEAAVDPEMLGRAFESLMMSRERRSTGTYFTPAAIVASATEQAIATALAGTGLDPDLVRGAVQRAAVPHAWHARLAARAAELRVVDPACGSGAFLVYALERIAALRRACGDHRPIADVRRDVLTTSIFGVDIHPTAVWLCELRLWLSVVIESDDTDPMDVVPLPNLDRTIRVGDALTGADFASPHAIPLRGGARVALLRGRYARATGARKRTLATALDTAERAVALRELDAEIARAVADRRERLLAARTRDLFGARNGVTADDRRSLAGIRARLAALRARRRSVHADGALPFGFATQFPDVAVRGGFDIVVGNPPWVRLHNIAAATRARLRNEFFVFRHAAWRDGAAQANAGAGFAAQVDLASLFVERSVGLVRPGGTLALLLPAKPWRSLAGGGVRRLLADRTTVLAIEDWSEAPAVFDAATYPSLLVAQRRLSPPPPLLAVEPADDTKDCAARRAPDAPPLRIVNHGRDAELRWELPRATLTLDADAASPWLLVPPAVRNAFDRLRAAGVPLGESAFGRPLLGVKCGANDAFVVRVVRAGRTTSIVSAGDRRGEVETALLRPLLRGETVTPWRARVDGESLLWPHGPDYAPLDRLPPLVGRWLLDWQRVLRARADARGERWWTLFRTAGAHNETPRVVWADVARRPRAAVLAAGDPSVPLNSCYVMRCADDLDAATFAALLNSPLAAAWLAVVAEPARGGYRRFLGWTMSLLPVPRDWDRARATLGALGARALAGVPVSDAELFDAALLAWRVRRADVEPLVSWYTR